MTTIQRAWWTTVLVVAVSTVAVSDACGQMGFYQPGYSAPQPGTMYQGAYGPAGGGLAPAAYGPGWGYAMPASSQFAVLPVTQSVPAYYQEPVASDEDESAEAEPEEEYYLDSYYSRHGHGGHGSLLLGMLGLIAPYGEGGCCAPHWFDIHAEYVHLGLDNNGPLIEFSRDTGDTTRITSADLEYGEEPGFRITGAYQTGPGSNLEFTYLGMFDFSKTSTAVGVDELNSVFTDFTGPAGINVQEQYDLADWHEVSLANDFDSLELNYRRRWLGPTCLLKGSWMMGIRYVKLEERLRFDSVADRPAPAGGQGFCRVNATNYMTGPQIGGDLWLCLLPGLNVGLDGKFALLGNNAKQHTNIWGVDLTDNYVGIVPPEMVGNDKVSFLGEASVNVTYRVNHKFTIRGGYEMVFVEGVALALENFNPHVEGLFGDTRTPYLSDGGSLFYDGFTIGGEWMW